MNRSLRILTLLLSFALPGPAQDIQRIGALSGLEIRMAGYEAVLGDYAGRIGDLEAAAIKQAARIDAIRTGATVVDTPAELLEVAPKGGTILVDGTLRMPSTTVLAAAGTRLVGADRSAKIILPHDGKGGSVIHVAAPRVTIEGLEITTEHPLTPEAKAVQDIGISISSTAGVNVDDLVIRDCEIHHVFGGVWRYPGNQSAEPGRRWVIERNRIRSFAHSGIHLNWRYEGVEIVGNVIHGRAPGETHVVQFNGMWVGNYFDRGRIAWNDVAQVDRHAIEVWNSANSPANPNGNRHCQIIGNTVRDIGARAMEIENPVGAFGISAFGNGVFTLTDNLVENYVGIGMELYNDRTNLGRTTVRGGIIRGGRSGSTPTGMTIHGGLEVEVEGVTIADVQSTTTGAEAWGIDIRPRVGVGASGVRIHGCRFENAGNRMIYLNGDGAAVFQRVNISRNEFHYKSRPWPVPSGQHVAVYIQRALADVVLRDNVSWYAASIGAPVGGYQMEDASLMTAVLAGGAADGRIRGQFRSCQGASNLVLAW